jgi:hypothetical protein
MCADLRTSIHAYNFSDKKSMYKRFSLWFLLLRNKYPVKERFLCIEKEKTTVKMRERERKKEKVVYR